MAERGLASGSGVEQVARVVGSYVPGLGAFATKVIYDNTLSYMHGKPTRRTPKSRGLLFNLRQVTGYSLFLASGIARFYLWRAARGSLHAIA
jgi:hypothetical protein